MAGETPLELLFREVLNLNLFGFRSGLSFKSPAFSVDLRSDGNGPLSDEIGEAVSDNRILSLNLGMLRCVWRVLSARKFGTDPTALGPLLRPRVKGRAKLKGDRISVHWSSSHSAGGEEGGL